MHKAICRSGVRNAHTFAHGGCIRSWDLTQCSYVTTRPLSPDMYGLLSQWTLGWAAKPHSTESVMVLPSVHQLND